jgi:hypothetical protein
MDDLVGRYWSIRRLEVDGVIWTPKNGSDSGGNLRIDDDTLGAQMCTGVSAHVALTPTAITVDQLLPNGAYCWDDHQNTGQQQVEVLLRRVRRWSIEGDELTLVGEGVRATLHAEPRDDFPSTTLVSVPPDSLDARARQVCEARQYDDTVRATLQPHVVAAYDTTVDEAIDWYKATSHRPEDEDHPDPGPGTWYPPTPAEVRAQYAGDPDRYAALCWIQGFYDVPDPRRDPDQQYLEVVMVRPDGREWNLFGSDGPPKRPTVSR